MSRQRANCIECGQPITDEWRYAVIHHRPDPEKKLPVEFCSYKCRAKRIRRGDAKPSPYLKRE